MIEISIRLQRRPAPSPPKPRTRQKPAGQIPRELIALTVAHTHALFDEESQSFLQALLLFSKRSGPGSFVFEREQSLGLTARLSGGSKLLLRNPSSLMRSFGMQSFESCRLSHAVRSPRAEILARLRVMSA
jgi:hypothetical protein